MHRTCSWEIKRCEHREPDKLQGWADRSMEMKSKAISFPLLLCTRWLTQCFLKIAPRTACFHILHFLWAYHFLLYHGHGILRFILLTITNFCIFLMVPCLSDEWKILMLSFVCKSLQCLNYEVPESSGMTCAVLVLSLSTLFSSLHSFQNVGLQLGLITLVLALCYTFGKFNALFLSLSLSALWVAYPFRQYNFPMLDCLQLSSQAPYSCLLSLHHVTLFYLLSFILFRLQAYRICAKVFQLSWQIQCEQASHHQLLFHPVF